MNNKKPKKGRQEINGLYDGDAQRQRLIMSNYELCIMNYALSKARRFQELFFQPYTARKPNECRGHQSVHFLDRRN